MKSLRYSMRGLLYLATVAGLSFATCKLRDPNWDYLPFAEGWLEYAWNVAAVSTLAAFAAICAARGSFSQHCVNPGKAAVVTTVAIFPFALTMEWIWWYSLSGGPLVETGVKCLYLALDNPNQTIAAYSILACWALLAITRHWKWDHSQLECFSIGVCFYWLIYSLLHPIISQMEPISEWAA
ncbi:MAG: hypothetical protein AAGG48_31670 [Planctomycetota bacterium]